MRRSHPALAALVGLTLAATVLGGCGGDSDATATDPASDASMTAPADEPSQEPVGVRKTCAELYRPPAQLMPRALEFAHGSPSAEDASQAGEMVTALAEVEGRALGPLAVDIAVVRETVDAQRAAVESGADGPGLADFDAAANRLARHCELYND